MILDPRRIKNIIYCFWPYYYYEAWDFCFSILFLFHRWRISYNTWNYTLQLVIILINTIRNLSSKKNYTERNSISAVISLRRLLWEKFTDYLTGGRKLPSYQGNYTTAYPTRSEFVFSFLYNAQWCMGIRKAFNKKKRPLQKWRYPEGNNIGLMVTNIIILSRYLVRSCKTTPGVPLLWSLYF